MYRRFPGSFPRERNCEEWGKQDWEREKLSHAAVVAETGAGPTGTCRAAMALPSCPELRLGARPWDPPPPAHLLCIGCGLSLRGKCELGPGSSLQQRAIPEAPGSELSKLVDPVPPSPERESGAVTHGRPHTNIFLFLVPKWLDSQGYQQPR